MVEADGVQGVTFRARVCWDGMRIEPPCLELCVGGEMSGASAGHLVEVTRRRVRNVVEIADSGGDVDHFHSPGSDRIIPEEPATPLGAIGCSRGIELHASRRSHTSASALPIRWVDHRQVLVLVSVGLRFDGQRRRIHSGRQIGQRHRARHGAVQPGATVRDRTEVRSERPVVPRHRIGIEEDAPLDHRLEVGRRRVVPRRSLHDQWNEEIVRGTDPRFGHCIPTRWSQRRVCGRPARNQSTLPTCP